MGRKLHAQTRAEEVEDDLRIEQTVRVLAHHRGCTLHHDLKVEVGRVLIGHAEAARPEGSEQSVCAASVPIVPVLPTPRLAHVMRMHEVHKHVQGARRFQT